jgi:hypothetical protein
MGKAVSLAREAHVSEARHGAPGSSGVSGGIGKAVSLALDAHLRRDRAAPKMGHPDLLRGETLKFMATE